MTIALIFLAIASFADLASTAVALRNPRLSEANPALRWLFARFGALPTLIVLKGAYVGLAFWFGLAGMVPVWAVWLVAVVTGAVAANNIRLIIKD